MTPTGRLASLPGHANDTSRLRSSPAQAILDQIKLTLRQRVSRVIDLFRSLDRNAVRERERESITRSHASARVSTRDVRTCEHV